MMKPTQSDALVRAIRRLTIAVWALVALVGVYVGLYLIAYIPYFTSPGTFASNEVPSSNPSSVATAKYEKLHDLPPEEMIKRASVIVLTRHEVDGDRGKCVLAEILKQSPGTRFYYKVGDEFQHCSFNPKESSSYGEGQVTFFAGNPAQMRYSTTYFGERISGLGDMPLGELRAQIAAGQQAAK